MFSTIRYTSRILTTSDRKRETCRIDCILICATHGQDFIGQCGTKVDGRSPTPTCFPTRLENVETGLLVRYIQQGPGLGVCDRYIFTPDSHARCLSLSFVPLDLWLSEDCPLLDVLTIRGLPEVAQVYANFLLRLKSTRTGTAFKKKGPSSITKA